MLTILYSYKPETIKRANVHPSGHCSFGIKHAPMAVASKRDSLFPQKHPPVLYKH